MLFEYLQVVANIGIVPHKILYKIWTNDFKYIAL